jgi:hypothetical protein
MLNIFHPGYGKMTDALKNSSSMGMKTNFSEDDSDKESIEVCSSNPVQQYLRSKIQFMKSYKLTSIQLTGYRDNRFTQCATDGDTYACPSDNQNEKYNLLESIMFNNIADVKWFVSYHPRNLTQLSIIDCDFNSSCLAILLNSTFCKNNKDLLRTIFKQIQHNKWLLNRIMHSMIKE